MRLLVPKSKRSRQDHDAPCSERGDRLCLSQRSAGNIINGDSAFDHRAFMSIRSQAW